MPATAHNMSAHEIGTAMFQQFGIVVKMTGRRQFPDEWPRNSPLDAMRFTFHMFNTKEDITTLVSALNELFNQNHS